MTARQKQCLLTFLGYDTGGVDGIWGEKSRHATECCQEDLGIPADGVWGEMTEAAVLEAVCNYDLVVDEAGDLVVAPKEETGTFWDEIEYFTPEEMCCKCGGKYCNGYPHEIQPLLMQICDRARRWSGHPIVIVSGLRCEQWNAIQGGVANSQHKYGEAVDAYFYGVTPGAALAWLQSQPEVRYAYIIPGSSNIHFDIDPVGR